MKAPYDRGLTPPELVDAPEAPADSPWVMTAEGLRATYADVEEDYGSSRADVPLMLIDELAYKLENDGTALFCATMRNSARHAVQAWHLPCSIKVVDLDGSVINCDRLEEWANGTLQARRAEDAADDALLRDL